MVACAGAACNFPRDYEIAQAPLMREIERCVCGSDYGATSWTTREQAARADARMEFSVISLARQPAGDDEQRLLQQSGPPYPDAEADDAVLLEQTGWAPVERIDVTAEFTRCMEVLMEESHPRRSALLALLGDEDSVDRLKRRRCTLAAVACGLLRREIFFAQPSQLAVRDTAGPS